MDGMMKVAIMEGIGKMGYTRRPIPSPQADEVLVKLEYVGICGSDMHYYDTGAIGDYVVEPPFVLGHESGGVVVEVGKAVTHLKVGDRVALEPGKTISIRYRKNMFEQAEIDVIRSDFRTVIEAAAAESDITVAELERRLDNM